MTLLSLIAPGLAGGVLLTGWKNFLNQWFGVGSFLMVFALGVTGLLLLRRQTRSLPDQKSGLQPIPSNMLSDNIRSAVPWRRLFILEIGSFTFLALLAVIGGNSLERAEFGLDGGRIGWGLAELVRTLEYPEENIQ